VHLGSHYQSEAAHLMGISRQTLGRILNNAHTNITTALSRGLAIRIQGGDYVDFPEVEPRRRRFRGGRKG